MNAVLKYLLGEHLKAVVETAAEKRSLVLDLSHQDICDVPEDIVTCRLLEHLYLHCNRLSEFPSRVFDLRNLTTLTLDYNKLTSLPRDVGQLRQLTHLNVSHNPLGRLCTEICQLAQLEGLWCNNTDIEELPPEIGNLTQLDVLGARGNRIRTIPDTICKLTKLRWLTLENNQIERLPEEIGAMSSLIHLNVRRNRIEDIPASIANCKRLAYFRINDNVLTKLPEEFVAAMATMPRLAVVDMHEDTVDDSEEAETSQDLPSDDTWTQGTSSQEAPPPTGIVELVPEIEQDPASVTRIDTQNDTEPAEGESEASDEDWENSVASYDLDLDYRSDEDNRHDVEELGMALPFLSKYTSLAS